MKVLITGGTGFIGSSLGESLLSLGHEVTLIGRRPHAGGEGRPGLTRLSADTTLSGEWQRHVAEQDAIINLAGTPVFHFWTTARKEAIYCSRIRTTRNLVAALSKRSGTVLLNASAAGYYGEGGDADKVESSPSGRDFLAMVCREWEAEALLAADKGARVVLTRFGVVLGRNQGPLPLMKRFCQWGLSGPLGHGRQWFPWIHVDDLTAALRFLLFAEELHGPFNCVAPQAVRQKEFARCLGKALHRPALLPAPSVLVRLFLGEFGRSLLQGQKVRPLALEESGFVFSHPELAPALKDLLYG